MNDYKLLVKINKNKWNTMHAKKQFLTIIKWFEATEKGLKQGIEKSIEIVAKKLIAAGYPTDTIAQLTDISSNIIEKMRTDTE